jgi:hypothetical protein
LIRSLPVSAITHRAQPAQVLASGRWADCLGRDFSQTKLGGAGIPLAAYATFRLPPSVSGRVRLEHPVGPARTSGVHLVEPFLIGVVGLKQSSHAILTALVLVLGNAPEFCS